MSLKLKISGLVSTNIEWTSNSNNSNQNGWTASEEDVNVTNNSNSGDKGDYTIAVSDGSCTVYDVVTVVVDDPTFAKSYIV